MARGPQATAAARRRKDAEIKAQYDASKHGRRVAGWRPPSSGPQRAVEGLETIRNRAHDVQRNDWAGASGVQKWTTTLVGVGITPRWDDEALEEAWALSVSEIDADGTCDAYGQQALAVRSLVGTGEVFLRNRPRPFGTRLNAPTQVQAVESDFVPMLDTDAWPGLPQGHKIRQGVEFDRYGERKAYWLYKEHPGDKPLATSHNDLVRVAAREISHVFEPTRPGQIRGVSDLAPILVRLRSSMDFEDAVLDRQKLANLFVMFITRAIPDFSRLEVDPKTGLPVCYDASGRPIAALEPGISQELDPGQDVKFANPPEAGTTFSEYMRSTHMGTAAGIGLPYEIFSGDIKDISDRTLRVLINEFRRYAEQRQWHTLIPKICQPIIKWWAEAKYLRGDFSQAQFAKAIRPEWAPHGWEYIHPVQDVEGKIKAIDAGLDARSNTISKRGDSPRKIAAARKQDEKLGLVPPPPPAPKPAVAPAPAPRALDDAVFLAQLGSTSADEQDSPWVHFAAGLTTLVGGLAQASASNDRIAASVAEMAVGMRALSERPVEIHNHLPQGEVTLNVEPTPVTVQNAVNVEPTPVTVQNDVTVEPAPVDVTVNLPDRETTSAIEHDEMGRIVNVTQTERTVN